MRRAYREGDSGLHYPVLGVKFTLAKATGMCGFVGVVDTQGVSDAVLNEMTGRALASRSRRCRTIVF
jgi:hypothetical protein